MTTYYKADYDNEALGPFTAEGANLTWAGGVGFIVTVKDDGTTGTLFFALVSGVAPADNVVLTQGTTTANVNEPVHTAATELLYPAYLREDASVAAGGAIDWTGPALGTTHSFFFDGQTANVVAGEILTFSSGETCEVVTVESDAGASGELSVRWITPTNLGFPADNTTFTGDIAGDGTLNGVVHNRSYVPLDLHRFMQFLGSSSSIFGNDDLSAIDPQASAKDTPTIVNLLGAMAITDTFSDHMYGGSISQAGGATLYAGLDIQVTSPLATTQPVVVQNDVIVTDYWKNAYNPDSIAGAVRTLIKVRDNGVDIDGKRVKGKLLEYGENYFEASTTLGSGATGLALFSSGDDNNNTAAATVAGAPYNTVVFTEGFQSIDYNNGNGATPFALQIDVGSASNLQTWERGKYLQRRGTAETLFGRNAQLVTGVNRNFAFDAETGGPFSEDEILAWGSIVTYTGQTVNFTLGEVVTFSGGGRGRLIYMEDLVATGTLIFDMEPGTVPVATETMTGLASGGNGTVGTFTSNTTAGTGLLIALDDQGTTGNLYYQALTGLDPIDNQAVFGSTSNASADVVGTVATRTINNQFAGTFTGANFTTNFGVGLQAADATKDDKLRNLLDVVQSPPDNQVGLVGSITAGDYVLVFAWDGVATDVNGNPEPDFNEATLAVALIAASSTIVNVGTAGIPDNTPQVGNIRVQRDSDGNYDLLPYASHDGDDEYTLVGTAPSAAAIANNVFRTPIDKVTAGTQESYTSVFSGTPNSVGITVVRGSVGPIKDFRSSANFGGTGFEVNAQRIDDA